MLAVMFSLTFILLLYAKFCHRAASFTANNTRHIHDGLPRSRSLVSGVDKTVVESLPFFRFSSLRGSRDGLECAVCLARFEEVDILRLLPKCKHAFHIDCIDKWLDKHSSCPLCRSKVTADDLSHLPLSTSLRFLSNPPPPPELERQESSLELYVEREESRHGSSRFCIGGSFRKKEEEEAPIPESMDCESPPSPAALHRFNHKIVVSEAVLKNRWSNVSSSDIMFLNSEILMNDVAEEEATRFSSVEERKTAEETVIMSIKEEMGKKRALEGKVREINKEMNFPATSSGANRAKLGFESSSINPNDKRSMSEIVVHPRFQDLGNKDSRVEEINVKDERTRRLWLPIVRKTVQWFANRERITPQSQESRLNI
ncbi:LOW QUALITY PROTEIN: E3 ubiquitin-protein ligase ATL42-like [Salvia splendens]|uniref:LOW QUALITY PROTEIN: E3 ubiquitin-protein ligase ATL42-like n=1 Tax=Salvia splendens TaxID=180675 RepID=UPI001C26C4C7|nr:LOW QUALITY PROTEIN: E3 ubiquitin-protein ligase ATL42-like [Salvia splendens]